MRKKDEEWFQQKWEENKQEERAAEAPRKRKRQARA
jgi:hypothetical protein